MGGEGIGNVPRRKAFETRTLGHNSTSYITCGPPSTTPFNHLDEWCPCCLIVLVLSTRNCPSLAFGTAHHPPRIAVPNRCP
jgi:hypothetical protein